jgi:hypothetical protein
MLVGHGGVSQSETAEQSRREKTHQMISESVRFKRKCSLIPFLDFSMKRDLTPFRLLLAGAHQMTSLAQTSPALAGIQP